MIVERAFRAMGTAFTLLVEAPPSPDVEVALDAAEREIGRLEDLLSRFDDASELSRLNRDGALDHPSPELVELVRRALVARQRTGGRFDPTVRDALLAVGYDRSFERLADDVGAELPLAGPCGGRVRVERGGGRIELDPGVTLDLGGIAKGWSADRVLPLLAAHGPALVNAGGDLAATGRPWPVGVEGVRDLTIEMTTGGLATSGVDRRRWTHRGRECHHVIDPRTGSPADCELVTATAVAPTAAEAEVAATALLLAGGAERAAAEANASSIPSVLVTRDGCTLLAGGLA